MKKIKIDTSYMDVSGEMLSKLEMLHIYGGSNAENLGSDDDPGLVGPGSGGGGGLRIYIRKCKTWGNCKKMCY